jgi:thiamine kinase
MHPPEVTSIARDSVPGNGEPRLMPLGAGLLNDTYRVDRDGRVFRMRVARKNSQDSSFLDRAWELEVLQEAAQRGLAPTLICGDAERGLLVQEWVEGCSWAASSVRHPANIARLADLLKRVHELSQPAPARVMLPGAWVEHYETALTAANAGVPAPFAAAAAMRLASLDALPRPAHVVCHSDLHLMNLLECPLPSTRTSALKLLDWEYAHISEPFWDLAGWGANNDFPDRELRALLCAYLGRVPAETEWTRCKLLVWLYDYVCLLWSKLYLNSSRGRVADGMGLPGKGRPGIATRMGVLNERLATEDRKL